MCELCNDQQWFKASDFMQPELGDLFVGYEATARMSELEREMPFLFERKMDGRFRLLRLKFENVEAESHQIPDNYKKILEQVGLLPQRLF